jgi:hypothetical protein
MSRKFKFKPDKPDPDDPDGPKNGRRADWAETAVDAFLSATGEAGGDYEDAISDLMADLLHYADKLGHDGEALLARAERNWRMER